MQGTPFTFVVDVAVTLTVWTQQVDSGDAPVPDGNEGAPEISPRNVFSAWELASIGYTDQIQSTPATVTALLAP